ncbi:MAG: P-loop NTPase [Alphaproteobacteria bacterium]
MSEEPVLTSPARILTVNGGLDAGPRAMARQHNLIAVASGKGGVGKTWFSITLSQALAGIGNRVLLVDGDLGLANVDVQLAMSPVHDLASVVAGKIKFSDAISAYAGGAVQRQDNPAALRRAPMGFDVLAGRSGSGALDSLSRKQIEILCGDLIRTAVMYDHLIVDLSAGINSHMIPLFSRIGKALILVTDDPTSITDAYATIKFLAALHPELDVQIVVNMAENKSQAEKTFGAVHRACEHFLQFTPKMAGYILRDRHVTQAIRAQAPLLARFPQSTAAMQVQQIAETLFAGGPRGLI